MTILSKILTTQSTTVDKIENTSDKVIRATWFLIFTCATVMGIYIYKMIHMGALNGARGTSWIESVFESQIINGKSIDSVVMWFALLRQTIQSTGSLSILIGITLIARDKKLFGPFNLFGNAMIFLNGLITGLVFEMIVRATMFTLYAIQFSKWDDRNANGVEPERANRNEWLVSIVITIGFVLVATIFTYVEVGGKQLGTYIGMNLTNNIIPYTDSLQSAWNIVGVWLIARRRTEGQFALVISNTAALIMFLSVGGDQAVMAMSTFQFLLVSFVAWFKWEAISNKKNRKERFAYVLKVNTVQMK